MGALTRAAAESATLLRLGPYTTQVARFSAADPSTGYVAELNEPLARALDSFAIQPANRAAVADADLAILAPTLQTRFLDLVEVLALESIRDRVALMPERQMWADYQVDRGDFIANLNALLTAKWDTYRRVYLYNGVPAVGRMTPASRNRLDTRPYFPPYPPPPLAPGWPWGPSGSQ